MAPRVVPSVAERHLLGRFSYGVTPQLFKAAQAAGGSRAWFEAQLSPGTIGDAAADEMRAWYPYLDKTPQQLWYDDQEGIRPSWEVGIDLQRWSVMRRTFSNRQLHEHMTEFWSNLLHVPAPGDKSWPHRSRYDATIRKHALGRFDDMLVACDLHPSMGAYLDNAQSTAGNINENLGRELLELHTVGIEAGYTEEDVRNSAYILTGWRVDMWDTWRGYYSYADHWTGPVKVLDFTDPNSSLDGRALSKRYLRYLAQHPATAQRIARRLCVRFVSDTPSEAIVSAVAAAFLNSGTDIKTTLRTLVDHPDFAAAVGQKTRTPSEDAVATIRALGIKVHAPTKRDDFALINIWQLANMGQQPFDWPRPDGFPDVADAWSGVSRVLGSWQVHWALAGGYWPKTGATYRSKAKWMPVLPAKFSVVVDDISRRVLSRPATPTLQQAVTAFTGIQPWERIRTADDIGDYRMTKLLSVVLDTPAHMSR